MEDECGTEEGTGDWRQMLPASSLHPGLPCVVGNCAHIFPKQALPGKGLERGDLLRGAKIIWGTWIYTRASALQILKEIHQNRKLESLESKDTNSQFVQDKEETPAAVAWIWGLWFISQWI